jgi:hypothetical protein
MPEAIILFIGVIGGLLLQLLFSKFPNVCPDTESNACREPSSASSA